MKVFLQVTVLVFLSLVLIVLAPAHRVLAAPINVGCTVGELISAIHSANSTDGADTLELATDCDYVLTAVDNTDETVGPNGLPRITSEIIINGNNATIERSAAEDTPAFRFFYVSPVGNLTLHQLTLLRGSFYYFGPVDAYPGAGVYNDRGSLHVQAVTFQHNWVRDDEWGWYGGAIMNWGGTAEITDSLFEANHSFNGGAIMNYEDSTMTVPHSTFRQNSGNYGGGIGNFGNATIRTSLFEDNEADTGDPDQVSYGGSIGNFETMTVIDSTIRDSHARMGGGISNDVNLTLLGSTITNNSSVNGGGVWNRGTLTVANSTVYRNQATKRGGGIFTNNKGSARLTNVTIARNQAKVGGNISTKGTFAIANTILTRGMPQNCVGTISGSVGNLRFPKNDGSCVGDFGDPKLGPLQDNGGPTETLALLPGSAAIGHAKLGKCTAEPVDGIDQRGNSRSAPCDSGAYETE